jgi:hypothetical protein
LNYSLYVAPFVEALKHDVFFPTAVWVYPGENRGIALHPKFPVRPVRSQGMVSIVLLLEALIHRVILPLYLPNSRAVKLSTHLQLTAEWQCGRPSVALAVDLSLRARSIAPNP